ncbi:MAG TPA: class I SAM-dependent methyltransferase [Streptosporangiaceae bacterium]|nr:class I SAM-dependent methyltransferase [Streptosporangiaceae bacterium]
MSQTVAAVEGTRAAYERNAAAYADATKGFEGYPGLRAALAGFADEVVAGSPVLDIGCGGGRDARLLAGRGRRVVACDISASMLTCARDHTAAPLRPLIGYVRLNMLDLPFADMSFGGVWACASLLHLPSQDIPRALSDIRRTLVPGGRVALSMRAGEGEGWRDGGTLPGRRWFTFVDPPGFAAELTRLGFCDVEIQFAGRRDWFIALGRRPSSSCPDPS